MAKYLVIFNARFSGGWSSPAEKTFESEIECDPGELKNNISDKKERLQNMGDETAGEESTFSVTVVQVLPL